jgi:Zn-finger nucleic acid-binding protein
MNCPVCNKEMSQEDFSGVTVDICRNGCRGIYFDSGEVTKIKQQNDAMTEALKEALDAPQSIDINRGQIKCPRCGTPMQRHPHFEANDIIVDECYVCGGLFLDSGELKAIKENVLTEEERRQRVDELLAKTTIYQQEHARMEAHKSMNQSGPDMSTILRMMDTTRGR